MTSPPRDLWPDLPPEVPTGPVFILREQAEALKARTKGKLVGRVGRSVRGGQFHLSFRIVIPNLDGYGDDYEYELFHVHHGAEVYPVIVDSSPIEDTSSGTKGLPDELSGMFRRGPRHLSSEAEFVEWLGKVLQSEHTKRVIGTLLAQTDLDVAS
jgi:hypothetical protein